MMPQPLDVEIRPADRETEGWACADIMASTDPWITLGSTREQTIRPVMMPAAEVYVAVLDGEIAGVVILAMEIPLIRGYIATLVVKPEFRDRRIGSRLLKFAEERILRDSTNVFLCVSSFNPDAQRFYERHGYKKVGELEDLLIAGASEFLLRKTTGPRTKFAKKR